MSTCSSLAKAMSWGLASHWRSWLLWPPYASCVGQGTRGYTSGGGRHGNGTAAERQASEARPVGPGKTVRSVGHAAEPFLAADSGSGEISLYDWPICPVVHAVTLRQLHGRHHLPNRMSTYGARVLGGELITPYNAVTFTTRSPGLSLAVAELRRKPQSRIGKTYPVLDKAPLKACPPLSAVRRRC